MKSRPRCEARRDAGYLHASYAASFDGDCRPLELAVAGGWLVRRPIEGAGLFDATGPYPLFRCRHWPGLEDDLRRLEKERSIVSASLVVDPLSLPEGDLLARIFNHVAFPFKTHYLIDLERPTRISSNHRRNISKALRSVDVEYCGDPATRQQEWVDLYSRLVERHRITGAAAFSHHTLAAQLRVPGLHLFRAVRRGETVGICLWLREGECCWYHLAAYSDAGYRAGASFALFEHAIGLFRETGARVLNLGGGAGSVATEDGLTRFKQGWANLTARAWFCGHVVDRSSYNQLMAETKSASGLFPPYRFG